MDPVRARRSHPSPVSGLVTSPTLSPTEPYQRGGPPIVLRWSNSGAPRAYVLVPSMKDAAVLGYIRFTAWRPGRSPISQNRITSSKNFAAQAVHCNGNNARRAQRMQQRTGDLQESTRIPDRDE